VRYKDVKVKFVDEFKVKIDLGAKKEDPKSFPEEVDDERTSSPVISRHG